MNDDDDESSTMMMNDNDDDDEFLLMCRNSNFQTQNRPTNKQRPVSCNILQR
jgi:hypothetical protein